MLLMAGTDTFCQDTANIWNILGLIVTVIKIVIPLLLIILGMVDLGKAVVSNDEKAISKSVSTLLKRFIAAVLVFFIPTIISALFNAVSGIDLKNPDEKDTEVCVQCLLNNSKGNTFGPKNQNCETYAEEALGVN